MDAEKLKELQGEMTCRDLATKLKITERTVISWRKKGVPVRWERMVRLVLRQPIKI